MRKKIFLISVSVICFFFLLCIIFGFFSNKNYAIKINGDTITYEELSVYVSYAALKEPYATDLTSEAVENAVSVYAAVRFAKDNGINTEAEDVEKSEKLFSQLEKKSNISKNILKKVCDDIIIYERVYNYITDNYVLSDSEFDSMFAEYYEDNKQNLNSVAISYIFISSNEHDIDYAENVYGKALNGYNFSGLAEKYSESEQSQIEDVRKSDMDNTVIDAVYEMKEGEIIMPETDRGFYIIKAEKIKTPDIDVLKNELKSTFIKRRKDDIYSQQNDKWLENDIIEKKEDL